MGGISQGNFYESHMNISAEQWTSLQLFKACGRTSKPRMNSEIGVIPIIMESRILIDPQRGNTKALYESINVDYSGMMEAVQTGNAKFLYELIQRDPYVLEYIDQIPFLDTPLHFAARTEYLPFVQEMINLKPSFARKLNQAGFSPMHLALQNDKMVLRLLKFDKNLVRVKGKEGMTPFHHAVQMGKIDILIKFLEVCPEAIEDVNVREETAFHIAVRHDKFEAFEVLVGWLKRSCHKAAQRWEKELPLSGDFEGNTILHIAVKTRPSVVKLLLDNFSHDQINVKNLELEGLTALDMACSEHEKDVSNSDKREIYDMLNNATFICSFVRKMSDSSAGRSILSLARKMSDSSARCSIRSLIPFLFLKKPNSSTKIDSLRSKMSCYNKIKTALARRRSGISEGMRNTFLVVTVLIITATYTASLNPPKRAQQDAGNGGTGSGGAGSSYSFLLGIQLVDFYSLFWMYNTLTFWASVWLTAFLLPSRSSVCSFLLIALSLFCSCYMLLILAVSSDTGSFFHLLFVSLSPNHWYYSISVMNYIFSTLLALLVAYRIARYICLKLLKTRLGLLFLILLVSFLFIALCILFPVVLFSEVMWRSIIPALSDYELLQYYSSPRH